MDDPRAVNNESTDVENLSAFEILADYERRSLAHVAGAPEQTLAPGLWRGIGFRLGRRHLVAALGEVNELLAFTRVTPVPGTRAWLLGVASVRGNLIPLVDLKRFLTGEPGVLAEASRIVVVRQPGGHVGLLVDEVFGQRNFTEQQRVEVDAAADDPIAPYIVANFALGDVHWSQFSMAALVRAAEFVQAAA
jgi:twitching motility protein PilI